MSAVARSKARARSAPRPTRTASSRQNPDCRFRNLIFHRFCQFCRICRVQAAVRRHTSRRPRAFIWSDLILRKPSATAESRISQRLYSAPNGQDSAGFGFCQDSADSALLLLWRPGILLWGFWILLCCCCSVRRFCVRFSGFCSAESRIAETASEQNPTSDSSLLSTESEQNPEFSESGVEQNPTLKTLFCMTGPSCRQRKVPTRFQQPRCGVPLPAPPQT